MKQLLILMLLPSFLSAQSIQRDPFSSLTPEQRVILEPSVARYVADQIKRNWSDLWAIQDQTIEVKRDLMQGEVGPDLDRKQFTRAMKEMIETGGRPHLTKFELQEVRPDKGNFLVVGCGSAVRESSQFHGTVIFGARIVDGKPSFDIFSFVSDKCS